MQSCVNLGPLSFAPQQEKFQTKNVISVEDIECSDQEFEVPKFQLNSIIRSRVSEDVRDLQG